MTLFDIVTRVECITIYGKNSRNVLKMMTSWKKSETEKVGYYTFVYFLKRQ